MSESLRLVEKHYSVGEVALLLSMSDRWVRERIADHTFQAHKLAGNKVIIPASSVNLFLDRTRVGVGAGVVFAGQ